MRKSVVVIHAEPAAPAKPPQGAACNGCGLCCLAEPCPLGMLVSRSRAGACAAVRWDVTGRRYRCGMLVEPALVLGLGDGRLARAAAPVVAALARRWIAAGIGCDAGFEVDGDVAPPGLPIQGADAAGPAPRGNSPEPPIVTPPWAPPTPTPTPTRPSLPIVTPTPPARPIGIVIPAPSDAQPAAAATKPSSAAAHAREQADRDMDRA